MNIQNQKQNIPYFLKKYQSCIRSVSQAQREAFKPLKIAILSSSTIKGMKEVLFVKCFDLGIFADIYVGEYNQYSQEILNPTSGLHQFEPDLIFLFVDFQSLLGDQHYFHYTGLSPSERSRLLHDTDENLEMIFLAVEEKFDAKLIIHNFEVPTESSLGIADSKEEFGLKEFVRTLNSNLVVNARSQQKRFIFDYESFCSKAGKENIIDYKMYYMGDIKLKFDCIPLLCDAYVSYIIPFAGLTKKCLVLDLDNTLWGGVVGEDGVEGIHIGPTPAGRSFYEFQHYILSLYNRGVILAANSKNNEDDALDVFEKHPQMVLKKKHFAAMAINWNDKASNMRALARELNIGLDSMVFVDDDPLNRAIIKSETPEVVVVDLPEDPTLYLKTIRGITWFNSFQILDEDRMKGKMYTAQNERAQLRDTTSSLEQYLSALEIEIQIDTVDKNNRARVSQLTQKTNQFNLTTIRYQEEDVETMIHDEDKLCLCCSVKDKFGDSGIVGVAIVNKKINQWDIDTFLLSCRVLGREIERSFLGAILKMAETAKIEVVIGHYIPSAKNGQVSEFYLNNGFEPQTMLGGDEGRIFVFKMEAYSDFAKKIPSFIKVCNVK